MLEIPAHYTLRCLDCHVFGLITENSSDRMNDGLPSRLSYTHFLALLFVHVHVILFRFYCFCATSQRRRDQGHLRGRQLEQQGRDEEPGVWRKEVTTMVPRPRVVDALPGIPQVGTIPVTAACLLSALASFCCCPLRLCAVNICRGLHVPSSLIRIMPSS